MTGTMTGGRRAILGSLYRDAVRLAARTHWSSRRPRALGVGVLSNPIVAMNIGIAALLAQSALLAHLSSPRPQEEPAVFLDLAFSDALALAKEEGKVVFVDFFTTWCGPCKRLDKTTWVDEDVVRWLAEKTVPLKLDAEIETALAKKYSVMSYPTMIFIDPDGSERGRLIGYRDTKDFLAESTARLAGRSELDELDEQLAENEEDGSLRMSRGAALQRLGRAEEALAEYLKCLDEGRQWPGFGGVRLSFLLSRISQLGATYPPALAAMRVRAEDAAERLLEGQGGSEDALDLGALNSTLKQSARTLEVYDALVERGSSSDVVLRVMFDQVIGLLLKAERYADVVAGAGDIFSRLDQKIEMYRDVKLRFADAEPGLSPVEYMRGSVVSDGADYYRALLGVDDVDQARRLAEHLLEFDPAGDTVRTLVRVAVKFEQYAAARGLVQLGYASLSADEHRDLERANRRLPKAERYVPE